jgi:hypothetical protein
MIGPSVQHGSRDVRRLVRAFNALDRADRETLLAFAEFLLHRRADAPSQRSHPAGVPDPDPIPRPAEETVVAAIKRLSKSYEMLDRGPMLNETSALMSAHVLQGRPAAEIIDELESLFERHYRDYRARHRQEG